MSELGGAVRLLALLVAHCHSIRRIRGRSAEGATTMRDPALAGESNGGTDWGELELNSHHFGRIETSTGFISLYSLK